MQHLGIQEEDIEEKFTLASGKGGQKINKSSSQVQLRHIPTGILIKCSQSRSQGENRLIARRMLVEKIEEIEQGKKSRAAREVDRIRKQKKRRSRKTQAKLIEDKRARSEKKELRRPPHGDE
jgi:protein subunit release factor B